MVLAAQQGLGPIDTLTNNAGVFPRVPFLEMTEHDWDEVLDVNLKGSCFCAQAVAKTMVAAGRQGSIINIASLAATYGMPFALHYTTSKAAVIGLAFAASSSGWRPRSTSFMCASFFRSIAVTRCVRIAVAVGFGRRRAM